MYCTLMPSRPCTAALFLGDPLYGFINDKVKEKVVLLSNCAVWKGVCQVSGGQRGSRYVAAGLPLLDGSSQILPAASPTFRVLVLITVSFHLDCFC